jgi:hypothetical protein
MRVVALTCALLRVAAQKLLGAAVHESRFVKADGRGVYAADVVYLPMFPFPSKMGEAPPRTAFSWVAPQLYSMSVARLQALHGVAAPPPRNLVLYLARSVRKRRVVNEGELLAAVEAALLPPYELSVLRDPSDWRADSLLVAQAVVLLGPHGGALSNAVFLRPDAASHVVEIVNDRLGDTILCYLGLASALGVTYWRANATMLSFDHPMVADVPSVIRILEAAGVAAATM